ncbi:hypothetical protein JYU34_017014 [Plutella xylostella]|uniref:Uncharacterized protein n=1 Tax=Plutella xylostella TaxID=51655 RepID=A0ABQ7Q4B7_PLUXY|nr:hypothetical protein JYU34_017014 [Plutella xylostella]
MLAFSVSASQAADIGAAYVLIIFLKQRSGSACRPRPPPTPPPRAPPAPPR